MRLTSKPSRMIRASVPHLLSWPKTIIWQLKSETLLLVCPLDSQKEFSMMLNASLERNLTIQKLKSVKDSGHLRWHPIRDLGSPNTSGKQKRRETKKKKPKLCVQSMSPNTFLKKWASAQTQDLELILKWQTDSALSQYPHTLLILKRKRPCQLLRWQI